MNYLHIVNVLRFIQRWEFIKENKKVRKQEKNSTNRVIKKKRKFFFFFSWSLSWSSSCFLTCLFSFINFHFRCVKENLQDPRINPTDILVKDILHDNGGNLI